MEKVFDSILCDSSLQALIYKHYVMVNIFVCTSVSKQSSFTALLIFQK
jgi:hypothetical protein